MKPSDDALYRVHQFQAERRGLPPLAYAEFSERLTSQNDTDLSQVFRPHSGGRRKPIIQLGLLMVTSSAIASVADDEITRALEVHESGNWGEVSPKQWMANDLAVANRGRICSAYRTRFGVKFWVITDADWRSTTAVMPEDTWFPGGIP